VIYPENGIGRFKIIYDKGTEDFVFMISQISPFSNAKLQVSSDQLEIFKNILKKYIEWEKIAQANKVSVSREIPHEEPFITTVTWKPGIQGYQEPQEYTASGLELAFHIKTYFSGSYYLQISSNEISLPDTRQNEIFGMEAVYKIDNLTFSTEKIENLLTSISEQGIRNAIQKAEEKTKEESKIDLLFQ
jgi:hypothetical protein